MQTSYLSHVSWFKSRNLLQCIFESQWFHSYRHLKKKANCELSAHRNLLIYNSVTHIAMGKQSDDLLIVRDGQDAANSYGSIVDPNEHAADHKPRMERHEMLGSAPSCCLYYVVRTNGWLPNLPQ